VTELLTNSEMSRADAIMLERGVAGVTLMEAAGRAVAADILSNYPPNKKILVLCGPGNNGGDGFVAARILRDQGREVAIFLFGSPEGLKGDAGHMAKLWDGKVEMLRPEVIDTADGLIVDAIFGAGLSRDIDGELAEVIVRIERKKLSVVSIDMPSGVDGTTGRIRGVAITAERTVTFFRPKPGHYLLPGRLKRGTLVTADIGIVADVLDEIKPATFANSPELFLAQYCWPSLEGHKYDRGHAMIISGPLSCTGAARLGAASALRIGAGLVTLISTPDALAINASQLTAVMVNQYADTAGLQEKLSDPRINSVLIGPGAGVGQATGENVATILQSGKATVLDADALTSFMHAPEILFQAIKSVRERTVIMTPHEGEFKRLFRSRQGPVEDRRTVQQEIDPKSAKTERVRRACQIAGAIIVLKGADTVIGAPDGRAAINHNAPPWLATAGSGDVLAGIIAGLLAQRLPAFEAACAAVWIHGMAAQQFGPGLTAEDLPGQIPVVLRGLAPPGLK